MQLEARAGSPSSGERERRLHPGLRGCVACAHFLGFTCSATIASSLVFVVLDIPFRCSARTSSLAFSSTFPMRRTRCANVSSLDRFNSAFATYHLDNMPRYPARSRSVGWEVRSPRGRSLQLERHRSTCERAGARAGGSIIAKTRSSTGCIPAASSTGVT